MQTRSRLSKAVRGMAASICTGMEESAYVQSMNQNHDRAASYYKMAARMAKLSGDANRSVTLTLRASGSLEDKSNEFAKNKYTQYLSAVILLDAMHVAHIAGIDNHSNVKLKLDTVRMRLRGALREDKSNDQEFEARLRKELKKYALLRKAIGE